MADEEPGDDLRLLSDAPITSAEDDLFLRVEWPELGPLRRLARLVAESRRPDAAGAAAGSILLDGPFGSGKTSAMRLLRGLIAEEMLRQGERSEARSGPGDLVDTTLNARQLVGLDDVPLRISALLTQTLLDRIRRLRTWADGIRSNTPGAWDHVRDDVRSDVRHLDSALPQLAERQRRATTSIVPEPETPPGARYSPLSRTPDGLSLNDIGEALQKILSLGVHDENDVPSLRPRSLLVLFLDELDRVSEEVVGGVLDTILRYAGYDGIWFVLAADWAHLNNNWRRFRQRTATAAAPLDSLFEQAEASPAAEMEKLLPHQLRMPTLQAEIRSDQGRDSIQELLGEERLRLTARWLSSRGLTQPRESPFVRDSDYAQRPDGPESRRSSYVHGLLRRIAPGYVAAPASTSFLTSTDVDALAVTAAVWSAMLRFATPRLIKKVLNHHVQCGQPAEISLPVLPEQRQQLGREALASLFPEIELLRENYSSWFRSLVEAARRFQIVPSMMEFEDAVKRTFGERRWPAPLSGHRQWEWLLLVDLLALCLDGGAPPAGGAGGGGGAWGAAGPRPGGPVPPILGARKDAEAKRDAPPAAPPPNLPGSGATPTHVLDSDAMHRAKVVAESPSPLAVRRPSSPASGAGDAADAGLPDPRELDWEGLAEEFRLAPSEEAAVRTWAGGLQMGSSLEVDFRLQQLETAEAAAVLRGLAVLMLRGEAVMFDADLAGNLGAYAYQRGLPATMYVLFWNALRSNSRHENNLLNFAYALGNTRHAVPRTLLSAWSAAAAWAIAAASAQQTPQQPTRIQIEAWRLHWQEAGRPPGEGDAEELAARILAASRQIRPAELGVFLDVTGFFHPTGRLPFAKLGLALAAAAELDTGEGEEDAVARGVADFLASSDEPEEEDVAIFMYRRLIEHAESRQAATAATNVATLLRTRRPRAALDLGIWAYARLDGIDREKLGRLLMRLLIESERTDDARQLQAGTWVPPSVRSPGEVLAEEGEIGREPPWDDREIERVRDRLRERAHSVEVATATARDAAGEGAPEAADLVAPRPGGRDALVAGWLDAPERLWAELVPREAMLQWAQRLALPPSSEGEVRRRLAREPVSVWDDIVDAYAETGGADVADAIMRYAAIRCMQNEIGTATAADLNNLAVSAENYARDGAIGYVLYSAAVARQPRDERVLFAFLDFLMGPKTTADEHLRLLSRKAGNLVVAILESLPVGADPLRHEVLLRTWRWHSEPHTRSDSDWADLLRRGLDRYGGDRRQVNWLFRALLRTAPPGRQRVHADLYETVERARGDSEHLKYLLRTFADFLAESGADDDQRLALSYYGELLRTELGLGAEPTPAALHNVAALLRRRDPKAARALAFAAYRRLPHDRKFAAMLATLLRDAGQPREAFQVLQGAPELQDAERDAPTLEEILQHPEFAWTAPAAAGPAAAIDEVPGPAADAPPAAGPDRKDRKEEP